MEEKRENTEKISMRNEAIERSGFVLSDPLVIKQHQQQGKKTLDFRSFFLFVCWVKKRSQGLYNVIRPKK
jgi:hypothetical protein